MKPVYSVGALLRYIKASYEQDEQLRAILVKGEISNFTAHRSGHYYFSLKDTSGRISCVMFASYVRKLNIKLEEGMKVIVHASLSMYEATGSTQLYVTGVQADGIGDLFLRFEQLKRQLREEGLFDDAHKKKLPLYPMDIAIITAKEGAAIHDIMTTMNKRWPIAKISLYPSLVQGEGAALNLMERLLQADEAGHDLIILARGGGSLEDLWCFNDERLARLIYDLKTVIVTGVGHESDTTLVDYVADRRFATPTAAVAHSVPDLREVKEQLEAMRKYLYERIWTRLRHAHSELLLIKRFRYFDQPMLLLHDEEMRFAMQERRFLETRQRFYKQRETLQKRSAQFAYLSSRCMKKEEQALLTKRHTLLSHIQEKLKITKNTMEKQIALLDAYNPLAVLKRGYAIVSDEEGIIRSIRDVHDKDRLSIRLQDGRIQVEVVNQEESK